MKISDKFHLEDIYKLKNTVLTGNTEDLEWRIKNINIVSKLLDENKKEIILPRNKGARNIILIQPKNFCPEIYPRKVGKPEKKPL